MSIQDIRFTGYTTLANCESEPIHVPGTTQPYGLLLVINTHTQQIDFCSANTADFLNLAVQDVLGKTFEDLISPHEWANINRHLTENTPEQLYTLTYRSVCFSTSLFQQGDLLLLEIERLTDQLMPDVFQQSRNFVSYLEKSTSLRQLCTYVVEEIRSITGYDRVMVYRFDNEFNGEVYAESVGEDIDSFLGLHYPHTDIPPQARALFARNLLRMIPDVHYQPVGVMTRQQDATHQSLDLSSGNLRSVSPMHIEYLKNMGVEASLTVSLLHNNQLWGLIACHHATPKLLPPYTRLATKLHAHFLSSQISNRQASKGNALTARINQQLEPMLRDITNSPINQYITNSHFYDCIQADGVAIITQEEIFLAGKTPDKHQITELVSWLDTRTDSDYYATSRLGDDYPQARAITDTASGVFFHSLHKASHQGVIWFRGERKQTIAWAGKPGKGGVDAAALILPRLSFARWNQVISETASPWEKAELDAGIRLATHIQNNVFLAYLTREEKKYRLQTHQLARANQELTHFNYICSHHLQEPMRKIQVFSAMLLADQPGAQGGAREQVLQKISVEARRAVNQINGLRDFASLSTESAVRIPVNLDACLERIKTDFELVIAEKQAVFTHPALGTINAIPNQFEQLLGHLIGNALKFSHGPGPHITLSLSQASSSDLLTNTPLDSQGLYRCLTISDDGIGFEPEFAESIFGLFYQLQDAQTYSGSGIGLAICKKILANHGGHIRAMSQPGQGSSFYLYLME